MRILVTGNMGYVGPVLVRHLRETWPGAELIGYDAGFFGHCLTGSDRLPETRLDRQIVGDVRDLDPALLDGLDAVVHLAAVSNDPMGKRFEAVTEAVNRDASAHIAEMAVARGVKAFVFASSCSMYGSADGGAKRETDPTNPLTAYARSKIGTEEALVRLAGRGTVLTSLRFSTACGFSDRLRLDLVLNDFVACAVSTGEITVLSDGSPWRPLIDVADMARAIEWAIGRRPEAGGDFLAINTGRDEANRQVRDLAQAVAARVPGTRVSIATDAPPDKRSYRVDFGLYRSLAPAHQPRVDLDTSIDRLIAGFTAMGFADPDFRNSPFMRLKTLERHIASGRLGEDLRWRDRG